MKILLIHGPNLTCSADASPRSTATQRSRRSTLRFRRAPRAAGAALLAFQSNHEGALIDFIQAEGWDADGIIINPGALTHYGLALRDALAALSASIVEVHLSNVYKREAFRHTSVIAPIAAGQIAGLGWQGYLLALEWLLAKDAAPT